MFQYKTHTGFDLLVLLCVKASGAPYYDNFTSLASQFNFAIFYDFDTYSFISHIYHLDTPTQLYIITYKTWIFLMSMSHKMSQLQDSAAVLHGPYLI